MTYTPKDPVLAPICVEFTPSPSFSSKQKKQVGFLWKNTSLFHSEDLLRLLLIVSAVVEEDSYHDQEQQEKHFIFGSDASVNWIAFERLWRRSQHLYDVSPVMKQQLAKGSDNAYGCKVVSLSKHLEKETSAELLSREIDNSRRKLYFLLNEEEVMEFIVSTVTSLYETLSYDRRDRFSQIFFDGANIGTLMGGRSTNIAKARAACANRMKDLLPLACDGIMPTLRFSNKPLSFSTSPDRERLSETQRAFSRTASDIDSVRRKLLKVKKISPKQLKAEMGATANNAAKMHLQKAIEELMKAEQALQAACNEAQVCYDNLKESK